MAKYRKEPETSVTDIIETRINKPSQVYNYIPDIDPGQDLSNYYTKAEVDSKIDSAVIHYQAGENVRISGSTISATNTTYQSSDFDIKYLSDEDNLKTAWTNKQDTLTAGNNITINNNVISASDPDLSNYYNKTEVNNIIKGIDIPKYTAGTNVSIDANNVISATDTTYTASDFDIKDLTDSTNLKSTWNNKQDQLTAGTNITIENNVISATGGSSNGLKQVDLTTYSDGVEGEIVQHVGSTTEDYDNGCIYQYKSSYGGSSSTQRTESIEVPTGSSVITLTNKFDNSVIRSYAINQDITVDVFTLNLGYGSKGSAYKLRSHDDIMLFPSDHPNRITNIDAYSHYRTLKTHFTDFLINNIPSEYKECYEYLLTHTFQAGFRLNQNTESTCGIITDCTIRVGFYAYEGVDKRSQDLMCRLSDFVNVYNLDITPLLNAWLSTHSWASGYEIDYYEVRDQIVTCDDGEYLIEVSGGGVGKGMDTLGELISDTGDTYYVPIDFQFSTADNLKGYGGNYLFSQKPVNYKMAWGDLYDVRVLYDYEFTVSTTSESVTIERKVNKYDEEGLPVIDIYKWVKIIDTLPISANNLWTSVTD